MPQSDISHVTIVGAGVAGLIAAFGGGDRGDQAGERGAQVTVHEAALTVGGRARSTDGEWRANYGPHALYGDGPLLPWLQARRLAPTLVRPPASGFRVRLDGRLRRAPLPLLRATLRLTGQAPHERSFGEWAAARAPGPVVAAAAGMASLPCFHPEPERLSAAFVAWRLRRVTRRAGAIRYIEGGWSTLVDALAAHARTLGVEIHLGSHVKELPATPVIIATSANSAAQLLGRPLPQHGSRVALLDLGLQMRPRRAPFAVLDLDSRTYLARYSHVDPSLAPASGCLIQGSAPLYEGETHEQAMSRLEHSLDELLPNWREHTAWRRAALAIDATGAIDPPGPQ